MSSVRVEYFFETTGRPPTPQTSKVMPIMSVSEHGELALLPEGQDLVHFRVVLFRDLSTVHTNDQQDYYRVILSLDFSLCKLPVEKTRFRSLNLDADLNTQTTHTPLILESACILSRPF